MHLSTVRLGEFLVAGFGGSNITPFDTNLEFEDGEAERLLSILPSDLDILVSHSPPYATKCDRTTVGAHAGSKPVRGFVERHRPRIVLCGHIHEARGVDRMSSTFIANPGALAQGFYAILEISSKTTIQLRNL